VKSIEVVSSPEWNFCARPRTYLEDGESAYYYLGKFKGRANTYSALRCERPAVRRASMELVQTWDGVGKECRATSG